MLAYAIRYEVGGSKGKVGRWYSTAFGRPLSYSGDIESMVGQAEVRRARTSQTLTEARRFEHVKQKSTVLM